MGGAVPFDLGPRFALSALMPGNSIAAPNDMVTGWTANALTVAGSNLRATAANDFHILSRSRTKAAAVQTHILSCIARPDFTGSGPRFVLQLDDAVQAGAIVTVDIAAGTWAFSGFGSGFTVRSFQMTPTGNASEFLFRFVARSNSATTVRAILGIASPAGGSGAQWAGDTTKGFNVSAAGFASLAEVNAAYAPVAISTPTTKPLILLSTDFDTDPGDVGALATLVAEAKAGRCDILGVVTDSSNDYSTPAIKAMLNWSGLTTVPVGAYKGTAVQPSNSDYTQDITNNFGQAGKTRADFPDAVPLMRQLIANAPRSVTVVGIGSMVNLAGLLTSAGDANSSLSGLALVNAKVRRLVLEAGSYPSSDLQDYNTKIALAEAQTVWRDWPTEIVSAGVELCSGPNNDQKLILNGPGTGMDTSPTGNPYARAYSLVSFATNGLREAWDEMAVLFATRNAAANLAAGSNSGAVLVGDGSTYDWTALPGQAAYLTKTASDASFSTLFQTLFKAA